jgi:hypothetical protein
VQNMPPAGEGKAGHEQRSSRQYLCQPYLCAGATGMLHVCRAC